MLLCMPVAKMAESDDERMLSCVAVYCGAHYGKRSLYEQKVIGESKSRDCAVITW